MTTQEFIDRYHPCGEARIWLAANASTIEEAWAKTTRLDWMLWAAMHSNLKFVVLKEILLPIRITEADDLAVLNALDNPEQADWRMLANNLAFATYSYQSITSAVAHVVFAARAINVDNAAGHAIDAYRSAANHANHNYTEHLITKLKSLSPVW